MRTHFPACEHNVKRLRTCKTAVTPAVLFTVNVPSLIELCALKISKYCEHGCANIFEQHPCTGPFNNYVTQLLIHYLDDENLFKLLSSSKSFLRTPGLSNINELCLAKRNFDSGLSESENIMKCLSHHNIDTLAVSETDITSDSLGQLSEHNLLHLDISYCLHLELFDSVFKFTNLSYLNMERTNFKLTSTTALCFFKLQGLRWLGLSKLKKHNTQALSIHLLTSVTQDLVGLDLSETLWDISTHDRLLHFKKLEYLDISHYPVTSQDPELALYDDVIGNTVCLMRSLKSLDISGCILRREDFIYEIKHLNLEFLGIIGDHFFYLQDVDSLAKKIASHRKLEHVLVILRKYVNNVAVLESALKNLYTLHRDRVTLGYNTRHLEPQLFDAVLSTLERYPQGSQVQHIASACLYTLNHNYDVTRHGHQTPYTPYPGYDKHVRRAIILMVISINIHTNAWDVLRNSMGMLSQFCMHERNFMFFEIVCSLINVLQTQKNILKQSTVLSLSDPMRDKARQISTLTIRAINTCICQSECSKKKSVGRMDLIESILDISTLAFNMFKQSPHEPEAIEFCTLLLEAWSTLWNVTDEQPDNCDKFVEKGGLEFYYDTFLVCSKIETNDSHVSIKITTLIRNMLGLMGNIAEVQHIRPRLVNHELIHSFYSLRVYDNEAEHESDVIEIRYSAAGILSHICSDGPANWNITDPAYSAVLLGIEEAVDTWDITSTRSINYKSFNPILHILRIECPYPCKLWAVWALTNLCEFKRERFVPMLRRDGGVELLEVLMSEGECPDNVKRLCDITLKKAYDTTIGPEIAIGDE